MNSRYKVISKSVSGHCCFEYSVMDTAREGDAPPLCETYEEEDALLIADKLNAHSNKGAGL